MTSSSCEQDSFSHFLPCLQDAVDVLNDPIFLKVFSYQRGFVFSYTY